ncbi:MAG: hypothetical protein ACKO83_05510, partial [Roseiflexaceae bacterium]
MATKLLHYIVLLTLMSSLFPLDVMHARANTRQRRPIIPIQARGYVAPHRAPRLPIITATTATTGADREQQLQTPTATATLTTTTVTSTRRAVTPTPALVATPQATVTHTPSATPASAHRGTLSRTPVTHGGASHVQPRLASNRMIAAGGYGSVLLSADGYATYFGGPTAWTQYELSREGIQGYISSVFMTKGTIVYTNSYNNVSKCQVVSNTGLDSSLCDIAENGDGTIFTIDEYVAGSKHALALGHGIDTSTKFLSVDCRAYTYQGGSDEGQCTPPSQYAYPNTANDLAHIATSDWHVLASKTDGTVIAWGCGMDLDAYPQTSRDYGQCTVPSGLNNVTAISAGVYHSMALKSDGTVVAWGCQNMPFFTPIWNAPDEPIYIGQCDVPAGLSGVVAIGAGMAHSVALKSDGTVVAWGCGPSRAYNNNSPNSGQCDVPAGLNGVVELSVGYNHTLARKSDGSVACWPRDSGACMDSDMGDVNDFNVNATTTPTPIPPTPTSTNTRTITPTPIALVLRDFNRIALSRMHRLAIKGNGSVVASGCNGPSGVIDAARCTVPTGIVNPVKVANNNRHSLVLMSNGSVKAFGCSVIGTYGSGSEDNGSCNVPSGLKAIDVSAGKYHSAAVRADGMGIVWGCAGTNEAGLNFIGGGQCGNWYSTNAKAVSAGTFHNLWLEQNPDGTGSVASQGCGYLYDYGQCTIPTTVQNSNVIAVAAGTYHSLALLNDGTVRAWGCIGRTSGQCSVPAGLSNVIAIAAGANHSLALKSDGTVVQWGETPSSWPWTTMP